MKLEQIKLPTPLSAEDEATFEEFDATEELISWSGEVAKKRIHHHMDLEWNAPRRTCVMHPSACSNPCDFYLFLQLIGAEEEYLFPSNTQLIMDAGSAIHAQYQYYLETRANHYGYEHKSEASFSHKNNENASLLKMGGRTDGLSIGWPIQAPLIWELKTISLKGFSRITSPQLAHVKQTHLYMLFFGAPVAIIVYICRDNAQPKAYKIRFNESVWRPLLTRLMTIRNKGFHMEEPERKLGATCRSCGFKKTCQPKLYQLGPPNGRFPVKI